MKKLRYYLLCVLTGLFAVSCIEDGVSTDASMQPVFSTDTLKLGEIFTADLTPTSRFTVYNHGDKILNINSITLRNDGDNIFRLNVDGFSGREFSNIEIRPNDSIFVFVEALPGENGKSVPIELNANIDFTTLGVTRTVVLNATTRDVTRLYGVTLSENTVFTAEKPIIVYDSLIVERGAELRVNEGTEILFHSKGYIRVRGRLTVLGTAENPVIFRGDRNGNVATNIPYEIMSGQWGGIILDPESESNSLSHTVIKNTEFGVIADNTDLVITNSVLRNSADVAFTSLHSRIECEGVEFAEAANGLVYLHGGEVSMDYCTLANNYLFAAVRGQALMLGHIDAESADDSGKPYLKADVRNSIIYGLGGDISKGNLTGTDVTLNRCIMRSSGEDDDNFINCLWDTDPVFHTVRSDYYFNYRVKDESPAIGAADVTLPLRFSKTDFYGNSRGDSVRDLGAYVYVPEEKN